MKDNSHKDKLESAIRELLINHEVELDPEDWNVIERALDTQPHVRSFKWNYVLTAAGILLFAGTYLFFHSVNSDKTETVRDEIKVVNEEKNDVAIIPAETDTVILQASVSKEPDADFISQQEALSSKKPESIRETSQKKEVREKLIQQQDTEMPGFLVQKKKKNREEDTVKKTGFTQKKELIIVNGDTINEYHTDLIEDKEIIPAINIQDNVESVSDVTEKMDVNNEVTPVNDSLLPQSTPSHKRKLRLPKRK